MLADLVRRARVKKFAEFVSASNSTAYASVLPSSGTPFAVPIPTGSLAGQLVVGQIMYGRNPAGGSWVSVDGATIHADVVSPNASDRICVFSKLLTSGDITRGTLRFYVVNAVTSDVLVYSCSTYKSVNVVSGSISQILFVNAVSYTTFNFTVPNATEKGTLLVVANGYGSVSGAGHSYTMNEPAGWTRRSRCNFINSNYGQIAIDKNATPGTGGGTYLMGHTGADTFYYMIVYYLLLKTQ